MTSKMLPSELQPGQKAERCPRCGFIAFIPWTLCRDRNLLTPLCTWVCVSCQRLRNVRARRQSAVHEVDEPTQPREAAAVERQEESWQLLELPAPHLENAPHRFGWATTSWVIALSQGTGGSQFRTGNF